jgi:DNA-directed RNA polymerase
MAVISAHEAMTQCLLLSGKTGREGVPLAKIAASIGAAVETEVLSQRRMRERFYNPSKSNVTDSEEDDDSETNSTGTGKKKPETPGPSASSLDRWTFSASHLKLFMAELERLDPKMGKKSKRSITAAVLRAKRAMNSEEGWTKDDTIHLGAALIAILVEHTKVNNNGKQEPAFRVEKRWTPKKKSVSFVVLNENLYSMFTEDELVSWAASTTRYTPMITPPTEWTGPRNGGYRWLKASLMRTHGSRVQNEALKLGDLSLVYDGLNILGSTAWKINKEILEIGKTCWTRNIPIGDIPSRTDLEVPPEPKRPERLPPGSYGDKANPAVLAANEANKIYRENIYKRQRIIQKNMVSSN